MIEKFTPAPVLFIKDLETLKILADPLRNQILEVLAPEKLTVNQIAEKLGLSPSKLYYHIKQLEQHGLIREVDSTIKANIIEKVYWITAFECKMDKDLCSFSTTEGQQSIITSMIAPIETTREDLQRSLEARALAIEQGAKEHPRTVLIYRELRNVSDQKATEFIACLKAVIDDFEEHESEERGDDVHTRALTIAFYPSFYYEQPDNREEE